TVSSTGFMASVTVPPVGGGRLRPELILPVGVMLEVVLVFGLGFPEGAGLADLGHDRDESSDRRGQRLVIVLKRDAVAKVVLNNLYKHTQLQDTFGANMLALVDGVPRTLRLDQMIRYWVTHQIEVIVRRTRFRLRKAQERMQ